MTAIATAAVWSLGSTVAWAQAEKRDRSVSILYNAVKSEVDPQKMESLLTQLEQKGTEEGNAEMLIDASRSMTAIAYAEAGNAEKAKYWVNRITDQSWKSNGVLAVSRGLIDAGALKEAEELIRPLSGQPGIASFQYGLILFKRKAYKEALTYLAAGAQGQRGLSTKDAEIYTFALLGAGEQDAAFKEAQRLLLQTANRTKEFKTAAERIFVHKYGNDQRYKSLVDSVEHVEHEKMLSRIAKMEVNEPAPDFELKDLNGKTVSLKSLRGKTVILDFWATWCQPCVASFPGMQKAVDYYKGDDSVVFMFIHTSEKSATASEDARRMITAKKHTFDVYMDLKNSTIGKSPVADSFKVSGIPAKFFIDKNGIIRYKNSGYISEEEAVPEIRTIVEQLKK